ncbi:metallo-beta-lactamase superfamily protein [Gemella morbillorum M424]|uniref:Ribonuclease J n=1 Tax=Gemella morbillorum TaxID=29391 RepID=A0AAP9HCE1_9BACL|nr:ribonuclease J [Gemella morbillorum]EFV35441.1 metallo-beta-lactamase superfamily protein [Gemella morbillorum M424]QGS08706.1 RNase J family beta-CASP ribonuclease [Gemella morbillorum]
MSNNNNISIAKNVQVSKSSNNKQKTHQKRNNNPINKKNINVEKNNIIKEVNSRENKAKKLTSKIRITPLGGVDEVAKNMYMIEIADEIFVLDAGLMFPETEMIGIDAVIPDISYLVRNKQKVRGIFLSNGHVSSMGAVPYIIDKLKCPVYGSKLTIDLLKNHLKHLGIKRRIKFYYVKENNKYDFNNASITFFKTTYSMPDSLGICIETSQGNIVYTGEFKFDQSVSKEYKSDIVKISTLGKKGVLALLSDSSNANMKGYNVPENEAAEQIDNAFYQANKRIIVTCYASNFLTISHIVRAALGQNRKLLLLGEAIEDSINTARNMNYLAIGDENLITVDELGNYPQNEICILSSGDQGEPIEAMKNIAEKNIKGIQIESGDTIMIAATPSPNMEVMLFQTLNLLVKLGAHVVTASKRLHAASHATREELKMMLNMLMPKFFVPVQGEFRNLRKHAEIAAETGVAANNIHILAKGATLEISGNRAKVIPNNVTVGNILVDGRGIGDVEDSVLKDRKLLSNDGIFVASYAISRKEKTLIGRPCIQTKGFVYVKKSMELIKEAEEKIIEYIESNPIKSIRECAAIKAEVRSMLSSLLYDNTKRKPIIIVNFTLI